MRKGKGAKLSLIVFSYIFIVQPYNFKIYSDGYHEYIFTYQEHAILFRNLKKSIFIEVKIFISLLEMNTFTNFSLKHLGFMMCNFV